LKDTIDALKELQAVDSEIRAFLEERGELEAQLGRLAQLLERGRAELDEKRHKLADVEKFYREKDGELRDDLDRAAKSKGRLASLAKQKEYLASQRELEQLKKTNSQKEEEILKLIEAIEEYKRGIAEDEEKLGALEQQLSLATASSTARLAELEAVIRDIESRKAGVATRLPKPVVRKYERILERREGMAVVEVRSGTCLGCNLQVPPQRFIELMKLESLMNCPNCQRFMFVGVIPEPNADVA
jgi:predicted  nucleic acid-binding Zn-ribbon protein